MTELQLAIFTGENARRIEAALAQLIRGGLTTDSESGKPASPSCSLTRPARSPSPLSICTIRPTRARSSWNTGISRLWPASEGRCVRRRPTYAGNTMSTCKRCPSLDAKVRVGPASGCMPEVRRPLYVPLNCYIEYERPKIREKLMPLVRVAQAGHSCAVIFICETQVAAERFQEEHQRLQRAHQVSFRLITSTHERVTKRDRSVG